MNLFKAEIFDSYDLLLVFIKANNIEMPEIKDIVESQVVELASIRNPASKKGDLKDARNRLEKEIREDYFRFIYFPWSNTCIKMFRKEEFTELRTSRNLYKISPEELKTLSEKHIVVIGMSVGKAVAQVMCLERICGKITLVDFDKLETTNMNRIMTSLNNIDEYKAVIAAREIAEFDPYIEVNIVLEGITKDNLQTVIGDSSKTNLLVEVCDSLEMKVRIREHCQKHKIPLIMDTSDRGMIDIERYDLFDDLPIFHNMLNRFNFKDFDFDDVEATSKLMSTIVNFENISSKAKFSLSQIGKTISTWPQLASSIYLGASSATFAAKKILLQETLETGRYYIDLEQILST